MLLWLLLAAHADPQPAGQPIDDVVAVQLTASGLSQLSGLVSQAAPLEPVALPPTSDAAGVSCVNYAYDLTDAVATVEITGARLRPTPGRLLVDVDLTVALNDPTDRFLLQTELFCQRQNCPGYVDPFPVTATAPVSLSVVPHEGARRIAVTIGTPELDNGLRSRDVHLDCTIGTVERVLGAIGLSLVELIVGAAERQLRDSLSDPLDDLRVELESALLALITDQEIDLGGVPLRIWTEPSTALVTADGLTLGLMLGADIAADDPCVAGHPVEHFQAVAAPIPSAADLGTADAGVLLGDGASHALLHAAWRGGLLCQRIDGAEGLGFPLDTSLLGALGGEPFQELFPESIPLIIETDPRRAPTVRPEEGQIVVVASDLGVDLFAELDGRIARAVGLTVGAELPARPALRDGVLDLSLDVARDRITVQATGNELAPQSSERLESGLRELLGTVLGGVLGDALGDFSFPVPGFGGVGLVSLQVGPGGAQDSWAAIGAALGPVEAQDPGEGCEGGCTSGGATGGVALLAIAALLRRRRRSA